MSNSPPPIFFFTPKVKNCVLLNYHYEYEVVDTQWRVPTPSIDTIKLQTRNFGCERITCSKFQIKKKLRYIHVRVQSHQCVPYDCPGPGSAGALCPMIMLLLALALITMIRLVRIFPNQILRWMMAYSSQWRIREYNSVSIVAILQRLQQIRELENKGIKQFKQL